MIAAPEARQLRGRFAVPEPPNLSEAELGQFHTKVVWQVRVRVLSVLKKWVEYHTYDFDTDPALHHVAKATGLLGCYLRNRVRAAKEDDTAYDVEALTAHAVEFGCPELAEAAEAFMKQRYQRGKTG